MKAAIYLTCRRAGACFVSKAYASGYQIVWLQEYDPPSRITSLAQAQAWMREEFWKNLLIWETQFEHDRCFLLGVPGIGNIKTTNRLTVERFIGQFMQSITGRLRSIQSKEVFIKRPAHDRAWLFIREHGFQETGHAIDALAMALKAGWITDGIEIERYRP